MQVEDRAGLGEAATLELERELAPIATLHELILWGIARDRIVSDVVVQDEFTHDVLMPFADDRFLVFDST